MRRADPERAAVEQERARRAHHLAVAAAVSAQQAGAARGGALSAAAGCGGGPGVQQRKDEFLRNGAPQVPPNEEGKFVPISGALAAVRIVDRNGVKLVVKTYDPRGNDAAARAHLQNEMALTGRLRHPNIIAPQRLSKLGDGRVEFEMEFASGGSLADYLKRAKYAARAKTLPEPEAAALLLGLVEAVRYLHSNGIAHGDIKLGNAMLDGAGAVRLIGLGASFLSRF